MFSSAVRTALTPLRVQHLTAKRSFVSTVLLSKTYTDKTVAELRTELRSRGLSQTGNKATLLTRIRQSDIDAAAAVHTTQDLASAPVPTQAPARTVSTSAPIRAEQARTSENPSSHTASSFILDVKLPDVSLPVPEQPVEIPFLPDFWDSSSVKAKAKTDIPPSDTPKIMLAAGAATHAAGGPTYAGMSTASDNLFAPTSSSSPSSSPSLSISSKKLDGILGDVLDDFGIEVTSESTSNSDLTHSRTTSQGRTMDKDERRGAYTLLGILLGAWVVSGIAAPSSNKNEKEIENKAENKGH